LWRIHYKKGNGNLLVFIFSFEIQNHTEIQPDIWNTNLVRHILYFIWLKQYNFYEYIIYKIATNTSQEGEYKIIDIHSVFDIQNDIEIQPDIWNKN